MEKEEVFKSLEYIAIGKDTSLCEILHCLQGRLDTWRIEDRQIVFVFLDREEDGRWHYKVIYRVD